MTDPFSKLTTEDAIRAAYRKLAKTCHPDLRSDKDAAASEFRELTRIYEIALVRVKNRQPDPQPFVRPPPPRPTAKIISTVDVGEIERWEMDNFKQVAYTVRCTRELLFYGGELHITYKLRQSLWNGSHLKIFGNWKKRQLPSKSFQTHHNWPKSAFPYRLVPSS